MAAPDAIALLKADHRAVEALFEDFKKARGAARKAAIVHQICVDLTVHTMIEEEIFYPALERGWLIGNGDYWTPTELGRRFTNDVVELFLP